MPPPNDSTVVPVLLMSNESAAGKRAGSRLAAPSIAITRPSLRTGTPPMAVSALATPLADRAGLQPGIIAQRVRLLGMGQQGRGAVGEQVEHGAHTGHEYERQRLQQ